MQWIIPVLSAILGAGGVWTLIGTRAAAKAAKETAEATARPAAQQAVTADWAALMTFWQNELNVMRESHSQLQIKVEILAHQREDDLKYIEDLELHIWEELPPPPPLRRRHRKSEEET
ncbi:MAG: hypothetical protein ACXVYB_00315 [Arthrobacter sp.]